MDIFVSPMATVFARNIAFLSGSVLAVLILLTVWDEDVLNVEHVGLKESESQISFLLSQDADHHDCVRSNVGWCQGVHTQ